MIFVMTRGGSAFAEKVAFHIYRHSDLFNAFGSAAIKARAGMLEPGDVINQMGYEFVVDDDEIGEYVVVHIILPIREIEAMGEAAAASMGIDTTGLNDTERSDWNRIFVDSLKALLEKWQEIRCLNGPGENLTFEKAVYRKKPRNFR